ncbi:MAG: ChbG/HpnK family deacetylase [Clostridiales bacterium]|nr:ChbG/HpnK family deacetylase [Clostridiales bacterium]
MEKYLIVNADDCGMCRSANLATFELLQCGGITSTTIMMPCGWAVEACTFAKENPQFAIGVHLTMTSEWGRYRWAPLSRGKIDSLIDEQGYMYKSSAAFEKGADLGQVEEEIRAQIEKAKLIGLNPSHLDNHMGTLYGIETGRFELLELIFNIASEYKLPFRFPIKYLQSQLDNITLGISIDKKAVDFMFKKFGEFAKTKGVITPDYLIPHEWNGPQKDSYENFKEYMYELLKTFPEGVTETYIHPALDTIELKGTTSLWQRRVWEYEFYKDPETRKHIEKDCGIKMINYRDLVKIKS